MMNCAQLRGPGTNIKRLKIAFAVTSIALILGHLRALLSELPVQSEIQSSCTLGMGANTSLEFWSLTLF